MRSSAMTALFAVASIAVVGIMLTATSAAADDIEISWDHVHERVLDNGLQVVIIENHAVPIATIEIAVHNGAFTEPPELNGLSHLYEHMFFKANETFPSQEEYMARQRELGMVWNGTTGDERVNYFFTVTSHNLEAGVEFMADAITTPRFLPEELEREREVVLGEYDRNESNPYYFLYDGMDDLLWHTYGSRKDSLGDRQTISTATVDQMRWMQETYYVPNNSLIVLSGDVTPEQGFALAEQYLGHWEQAEDPFVTNPVPEHPPLEEITAKIVEQPVGVSAIQLAWHGPDTRNDVEATYAADIFSFILAQNGTEFRDALVESGVALDAGFGYQTLRYVGPVRFTAVVTPGQEQAAIEVMMQQIQRFDDPDYFTDEQIRTAATMLAIDELRTQQDTVSLAHTLTYWWATASIDYYTTYIDNLRAVTREDIVRYVQTYVQNKPFAAVLMAAQEHIAAAGITPDALVQSLEAAAGR